MTHGQLMAQMSVAEFGEWVAFYRHEQKERQEAEKKTGRKRRR